MGMRLLSAIEDPRRRERSAAAAKVLPGERNRAVEMQEALEQSGMPYEAVTEALRDLHGILLSLA